MAELVSPAYTRAIGQVLREIEPDPAQYRGIDYMPAVERPADSVIIDVWEAAGGMTLEHAPDTDPLLIQKRGFRSMQFSAASYREKMRFGESDIIRQRKLGTSDLSERGIQQFIEENVRKMNNRLEARMEGLRWQAIFNGSFVFQGRVIDFGVPALNSVMPAANWATRDSNGRLVANDAANPVLDLRYWVMGGYDQFRKYRVKKMVMNPNTARMFIESKAVQSLISPAITGGFVRTYDINAILSYIIPGIPEVDVYAGTYFNETFDAKTGQGGVSTSQYFIPDGKIMFDVDLPDGNRIGEIQMTLNLSNGDINAPAAGKFLVIDQRHLADPANPYLEIVSGFNGGPALTRGFDLLTATVFA